jgi:phosphocarrier protein HPr
MNDEQDPRLDALMPLSSEAVTPGPAMADAGSACANEPMLSRDIVICNKRGLHARAAAKFVTMAEKFGACVEVCRDGQAVSARSIMGLMMLGAGKGSVVQLHAQGWDAKEALESLAELVEAGFNEQD